MFPGKVIGKLCILLSAAVLAGACSRDTFADLPEPEKTEPVPTYFGSDGRAWLGLRIQGSDDTPGTRAIDDENGDMDVSFADGTENAVNDVYILLFAGATEDEAKFASAYKATTDNAQDGNNQIHKTHAVWLNDANVEPGDKLWAFALVNNNAKEAITTTGIDEQTGVTTVAFNDGTTLTSESTLATLQKVTVGKHTDSSGNYLMTSAPLSSKPGGSYNPTGATVSTLVPIPANAFYGTKEEALENPAIDLFVERTAAKIEVKLPNGTSELLVAGNKRLEIHTLEVALDRYNTRSYLVRRFNSDWLGYHAQDAKSTGNPYRFVDNDKQITTLYTTFRTYWAEDINYSGDAAEGNTTGKELTDCNEETDFQSLYDDTEASKVKTVAPWYVMENTFELEHQELEASTQLVLRAQIGPGTFYTIESTGEEFGDVVGPPKEELGTSASSSFARSTTRAAEDETDVKALDEYLRDWLMEEVEAVRTWVETYCESDPSYIVLTPGEPDETGAVKITASQTRFADESTATGATKWSTVKADIDTKLGTLTIKIYKNGYCYYRVPIRHFTEAQTPWELTKGMQHTTVSEIYLDKGTTATDQQKNDYLGRYGVVRNNWYELTIEEFTRIGSPTLTSVKDTDTADDNPTQFVSLKLSVLPWIQHTQPLQ